MGWEPKSGGDKAKWRKAPPSFPQALLPILRSPLGTSHLLKDWATREGRRRAGGGQRAADHLTGADRRWVLNGTRRLDGGNRTKEEGTKETRYPWYLPYSVGRSCAEPHVPSPCSFPPAQGPNTCLLPAFGWPSIPSPTRHYIRHLPFIMLDDTGSNPTQQAFFFGANLLVRSYPSGRPPVLNLASLYRYSDHTTEHPVIIKNVSSNLDYPCCLLNHSSNSTIELSTWLDTAS
ncbi:uncharacterized protein CLUP02_09128 [Colletotrichum lupini]|uniref:Uncharacterized protein n=1 Tax=Colletotrichum lupini TaxID=145971 RepID=A0A9Q8WHA6_9PEZI|nr:uncharacterized protein CLUP02_09128 [Colletotrichum lupini]UQC83633.1 hypothetical protein CLUP02_09128 [Colletotrichum lupini]